jgi:hypothetical protein
VFRLWNIPWKGISKHGPQIYSMDHFGLLFLMGKIVSFCYNCGPKTFAGIHLDLLHGSQWNKYGSHYEISKYGDIFMTTFFL